MNAADYLQRIRYTGSRTPDSVTLAALHRAHLLAVPFENLDIHLGRPITLDLPSRYAKIVTRRRGGFCYELNGLFAWLLAQLGYDVTLLSAGVYGGDGRPGPEYDHLTLLVRAPGDPTPWLADVGFGEGFREPLRLDVAGEQTRNGRGYRVEAPAISGPLSPWERDGVRVLNPGAAPQTLTPPLPEGEVEDGPHPLAPSPLVGEGRGEGIWRYFEADREGGWRARYWFTLAPREYGEFAEMCRWQQTSPDSHFTRNRLCSLATPQGRVTLADMTLIETERGERRETPVAAAAEYQRLLRDRFGVDPALGSS
ncbi:MAG: arylamine N-acetyltransferase [Anaerolineae bacterium]